MFFNKCSSINRMNFMFLPNPERIKCLLKKHNVMLSSTLKGSYVSV